MPDLPTTEQLDEIEQCHEAYISSGGEWRRTGASADDVPQLLAWIRAMLPGYALLWPARMTLDLVAAVGPDRWEQARREAEDVAQRIVDEIGHPVTDEPALGPDLRAENERLAAKVERMQAAAAAALKRGDSFAADLARARRELATAQSGCRCQDAPAGQAPTLEDCAHIIGMLLSVAAGDLTQGLDDDQRAERIARQIGVWVQPGRQAELAGRLVVKLADVCHAERTLRVQLAEATSNADLVRRAHAELLRLLDSERSAQWRPKAWPVRPLTDEQERSAAADEARTDWPVWVQPCDPMVAYDGDSLYLICGRDVDGDAKVIAEIVELEPTRRWSELVAAVVAHRCGRSDADSS